MDDSQDVSPSALEKGLSPQNSDTESSHTPSEPASPTNTESSSTSTRRLLRTPAPIASLWSKLVKRFGPRQLPEERQPKVRPVHGGPRGYPGLATFLDSDENFMVYRRFGYLQARLLLEKQERLRVLEEELDALDAEQTSPEDCGRILCSMNMNPTLKAEREELMLKVESGWNQYGGVHLCVRVLCSNTLPADLLQKAQAMVALGRPTSSEYRSVENYMENEKPLIEDEAESYYWKEDLISLRPGREHAWLDATMETMLRRLKCGFIEWVFCSKETKKKSNQTHEIYYTRSRIERAVVTVITFMILFLLILPIYLLFRLTEGVQTPHNNALCIGVLLVFTLAFSAVISLFTRAQRHEILAASAAYCAVLVVFFGNVTINSSQPGVVINSG